MTLTILEGSTFCICDELGDLDGGLDGLYAHDTRFLSTFTLTLGGRRPLLLSSGKVEYFSAAFYARNAPGDGLEQDVLSIARHRFVGSGLQDHVVLRNETRAPLAFTLELDFGTDFADIISVKQHDFALGDPLHAPELPPPAEAHFDEGRVVLVEGDGRGGRTQIVLSRVGEGRGGVVRFPVALAPHESWDVRVDVSVSLDGEVEPPEAVEGRFGTERQRVRDSLAAWSMHLPRLETTWDDLRHSFSQSVADLAALRLRAGEGPGLLPAAGMPWFMTVFGRDTIITSLQTMLLGPELAVSALGALAELQSDVDDPAIDAEPGKIVHELRSGRAADNWFARYYGTVDATPLYLVLLSEAWRWTGDSELAARFREPALAALRWIDEYGDRDGDGFVEYERRSARGLDNQSWKDSGDSQRFRDGRTAVPPIAPVEVQGYVYDAKRRLAELARHAWGDDALAGRLEREAAELAARFDEAFWIPDREGYYALALDGEKRQVDALCSNVGHLLWSGIVPEEKVDAVVDALGRHELWSGWGIRTMSKSDAAYSPLSYHNGTVWPHDTAIAAWGLARYGRCDPVHRIARALIEAARHMSWSLPEVFAGFDRSETPFPIAYPTAARPQAWAAGTPLLLLRLVLGVEPDVERGLLATLPGATALPGSRIELRGVRALGKIWDVESSPDGTTIEEAG